MVNGVEVLRYTAFSDDPDGGNPAGIVLDANGLDDAAMLDIAHEVGYSETAFLWPEPRRARTGCATSARSPRCRSAGTPPSPPRWHSPTTAPAASCASTRRRETLAVQVRSERNGHAVATMTSVTPAVTAVSDAVVAESLAALRWTRCRHRPAASAPRRLRRCPPPRLRRALTRAARRRSPTTSIASAMSWCARAGRPFSWCGARAPDVFHSRVPFPVGGVVEDPATGAAAAALGAYLRELGLVQPPATITIHQGDDMGRPSLLRVEVDPGGAGIRVSGTAVPIPG